MELIFIHFFLALIFIRFDPNLRIATKEIYLIQTNIYNVLQFIRVKFAQYKWGLNWKSNLPLII